MSTNNNKKVELERLRKNAKFLKDVVNFDKVLIDKRKLRLIKERK